ncbi:hypothetical protein FO441_11665 [Salinicoccus cyprini]|uniref:Uncharacterized protein n=1 Tax=Salinicoccus cyprini TaxID=2493691 RepID=A0A558AQW5_9STAP|nr:hypothetical protein FO441_11665 [Salinicoccus cyprini]
MNQIHYNRAQDHQMAQVGREFDMRRFRILVLAAMMGTVIAGCGMNNDDNNFDQQQTINDTTEQPMDDGSQ